ncbi:MAG: MoaD/ThiS family protein [Betaproteobacteria bacterium]
MAIDSPRFRIAIPTPLQSYVGGVAEVDVHVDRAKPTLADALMALDEAYPGIRFRMVDETGRVRPHIQIFVNAAIERNPAAVLPAGARIMLVGALSGG